MDKNSAFSIDKGLEAADNLVDEAFSKHLNDIQIATLKGVWENLTYEQIAIEYHCCPEYINSHVAFHLWHDLTDAVGEKVRKNNVKAVLERYWRSRQFHQTRTLPVKQGIKSIYIERPPLEAECNQELLKPGGLIRIKAPRKMGKTYLLTWLREIVEKQYGYMTVTFNMMRPSKSVLQDLDLLLKAVCQHIERKFVLDNCIEEFWLKNFDLDSCTRCTAYLEEYIFSQIKQPIVLAFDNVDRLFQYQIVSSDFFGLLRSWHEEAKEIESWQRIRLIIVHSTHNYLQLSTHRSPFNVGLSRPFSEFSKEQVYSWSQQLGLNESLGVDDEQLSVLFNMVGGHPYLVGDAFRQIQLQPEISLTELMQNAPTDAGIYADHLRDLLTQLQASKDLSETMKTVVNSEQPISINSNHHFILNSLGLIILVGNSIKPRNNLYRQYFKDHL